MRKLTKQEFIARSKIHHSDEYDYSQVIYENNRTKVEIFHDVCGCYFYQTPEKHMKGHGCPCLKGSKISVSKRDDKDSFVKKAIAVHGENYSYDSVLYVRSSEKVLIRCNRCGNDFYQKPNNHLMGKGCKVCAARKGAGSYTIDSVIGNDERSTYESIFYHVEITAPYGDRFNKIGITTDSLKKRFALHEFYGYKINEISSCKGTLRETKILEHIMMESLKRNNRLYKCHNLKKHKPRLSGCTECFYPV